VGFVVGKVALGHVFSEYFFPLPTFIPPIAPQSPSSIIWGWYKMPVVAAVPSGLSLTPLRIKKCRVGLYYCEAPHYAIFSLLATSLHLDPNILLKIVFPTTVNL
jgi:hypothetical protein